MLNTHTHICAHTHTHFSLLPTLEEIIHPTYLSLKTFGNALKALSFVWPLTLLC